MTTQAEYLLHTGEGTLSVTPQERMPALRPWILAVAAAAAASIGVFGVRGWQHRAPVGVPAVMLGAAGECALSLHGRTAVENDALHWWPEKGVPLEVGVGVVSDWQVLKAKSVPNEMQGATLLPITRQCPEGIRANISGMPAESELFVCGCRATMWDGGKIDYTCGYSSSLPAAPLNFTTLPTQLLIGDPRDTYNDYYCTCWQKSMPEGGSLLLPAVEFMPTAGCCPTCMQYIAVKAPSGACVPPYVPQL